MQPKWHELPILEVFEKTEGRRLGLSTDEAVRRLKKHGKNILPKRSGPGVLSLLLRQFNSPLIYILFIAIAVSFLLDHVADAVFIIIVLLINTLVGFWQEYKAGNALESLRTLVVVRAKVLRDGNEKEVPAEDLVPGDVIFIRAGDRIPADCRIIESRNLRVNESSLTGEWLASIKEAGTVAADAALGDRSNMLFMSTVTEEGEATAVVVSTGISTQIGAVVELVAESTERLTPLQKEIARLSKMVGIFVFAVVFVFAIIGLLRGQTFYEIFVASLALAVSAIPAGILPVITVILVLGMRRILTQNALVRKLIANETLGSVTVICTDKTGTLTEGKMDVAAVLTGSRELLVKENGKKIFDAEETNGHESHILALKIATLANEAFVENPQDDLHEWVVRGKATERALLVAGTHAGLQKGDLLKKLPLVDHIPFDSDNKYGASLHDVEKGKRALYVLGAPEVLISKSVDLHVDGDKEHIKSDVAKALLARLDELTGKGLRVVACAYRDLSTRSRFSNLENAVTKLTLVGFIALKDPLRPDSKVSIELTKKAGVRTVLITGDHGGTALAIAGEVGLPIHEGNVVLGSEIDKLSDDKLKQRVTTANIFARVSPSHKVRLVEALQANGEVVAMVGDGVNDAPALKVADVGVAVGSGSDVAKEVADVVLLDDNYKTIVSAIEQGRAIFENIRKVFVYLVADDFSQIFLFIAAMLFGLPLPLLAAQILWINLVEDGLPNIAMTTEQELAGVMDEPPRKADEPIMNEPIRKWMGVIFLASGLAAFLTFFASWKITGDIDLSRTLAFALMGLDSLIFAYSARSFKKGIIRKDIFSNRALVYATVISLMLLVCAVYVPLLQGVLGTTELSLNHWLYIAFVSIAEVMIIDYAKTVIFGRKKLAIEKI